MSITGILSGKLPVAKVVARDSYNANMVAALYHCSKYSLYQVCPYLAFSPENFLLLRWLLGTVTMPTWLQPCILVVSINCIKFGGEMCP